MQRWIPLATRNLSLFPWFHLIYGQVFVIANTLSDKVCGLLGENMICSRHIHSLHRGFYMEEHGMGKGDSTLDFNIEKSA